MSYPSRKVQEFRARLGWTISRQFAPLAGAPRKAIDYGPAIAERGYLDGCRWVENVVPCLRVHKAEEYVPRYNRSYLMTWYVDSFQTEATSAAVVQLPARNGQPRYCAATSDPYNENHYLVDFSTFHTEPEDAAKRACLLAERYSEDCLDDDFRQRVAGETESALDEIRIARESHSIAARSLGAASRSESPVVLTSILRDRMAAARESVKQLRERLHKLATNPSSVIH